MFLSRSRKPRNKVNVDLEKEDLLLLLHGFKHTIIDNNYVSITSPGLSFKDIAQMYYTHRLHNLHDKYKSTFYTRTGCFIMSRDVWDILDNPVLFMSCPVCVIEGENYVSVGRNSGDALT